MANTTHHVDVWKLQKQVSAFGRVRSPLELDVADDRIVVAGSQVFRIPRSRSFHEFLITYAFNKLGPEWARLHLLEGATREHPLAKHIQRGFRSFGGETKAAGELIAVKMNTDLYAFLAFAYDVFTLSDNANMQESLLIRVRNVDQYQGVRYEIFVAASLLRAGFSIEFEDESDLRRSHCEFTATFKKSNKSYSVEAKSRHRNMTVVQQQTIVKAGMYRLLQDALQKSASHERIIFADVNLPPDGAPFLQEDWHREVMGTLGELESKQKLRDPWPQAIIIFTNRKTSPWKGSKGNTSTVLLSGLNHPLLKIRDQQPFEAQYPEIGQLFSAMVHLAAPPGEFFGQNV